MKYSSLTENNQALLKALEEAGSKKRKQRSRHRKQFNTDPKFSAPRTGSVSVWEFLVDPYTPGNGCSPGTFRFLRRSQGSDVSWYWAEHAGDGVSFKKFEPITAIPSFKPVRETEAEDTGESATTATEAVLERQEIATVCKDEEAVPDSWDDGL